MGLQGTAAAGIRLTVDTTTSDADPGTGKWRANSTTFASITKLWIDNVQVGSGSITSWLDALDDGGGSAQRGILRFENLADSTQWAEFTVTGSVVDKTGYREIVVTPRANVGWPFVNAVTTLTSFVAAGAQGPTGTVGGSTGSNDNRLLRADGTGGANAQSSAITVDDSGNVTGAGNISFAGQLAFPATQSASAVANTLDDYEEGTFTPALTFGGAAVGITYTTQLGRYTKIGDRVLYSVFLVLSNKGSSTGAASLTGLPFSSISGSFVPGSGYINSSSAASNVVATIGSAATVISPNYFSGGNVAVLTNTDFGNTTSIALSGHYQTAT